MRSIFRVAVVLAAATLPVVGLSAGQAVAKPKPKATPQILVTCSPNPVVETATSNVTVICQVEANPSFAGKPVTISSTQLAARCTGAVVFDVFPVGGTNPITLPLDNDGNATILVFAEDCAPGSVLITADVDSPPFSTAITKLVIEPPQVTAPGVHAFPNPEVEVGDNPAVAPGTFANAASEVDAVFYVETNPVYAEQGANITSDQLTARCGQGAQWFSGVTGGILGGHGYTITPPIPITPPLTGIVAGPVPIDNDGNVVFFFFGASCAAGKSTVIAEILAGGPTYSTQFNILPPAVTI